MKIRSGFTLAVKLIFLLSLCVMLYSAFQILKAPAEAREALSIWDKEGGSPASRKFRRRNAAS